jgi:hypothetical protein
LHHIGWMVVRQSFDDLAAGTIIRRAIVYHNDVIGLARLGLGYW